MRILDRYLAKEYLVPVTYCVSGFAMLFVVWDLFYHFTKFAEASTPLLTVGKFYVCYLAQTMEVLLPASLLLATLYSLWRLSRHNEITAMRAGGVGLARILTPFLVVGSIASALTAALKEEFIPDAAQWVADFNRNKFIEPTSAIHSNFPYYSPSAGRRWMVTELDARHAAVLKGVKVTEERPGEGKRPRVVFAERAEWLDRQWWFYRVEVQELTTNGTPVGVRTALPHSNLGMPMPTLRERPVDFVNDLRDPLFFSASDIRRYLRAHPTASAAEVRERWTDYYALLAAPWACVIVVLFGVPAGARASRRDTVFGLLLAAGLFVLYYAVSQTGILLSRRGVLDPWVGPWLPNVLFAASGLVMLFRMR